MQTRDEQKLWIKNELWSLSNGADLAKKGYHSLTATKPKKNVVFPKAFDRVWGNDIYKFCKEIDEAIDAAQVKEDDNVKMFMETCLDKWCEDLHVRTRTGSVSMDDVKPRPVRMTGRRWTNESLKDTKNDESVKTTEVIRLSYEEKKVVRKEVRYDGQGNDDCLKVCQDPEDEKMRFDVTNWAKDKPDDVLSHDQGHEVAKSSARGDISRKHSSAICRKSHTWLCCKILVRN